MTTATPNGTFPQEARAAVELYLAKGLAPIPLPPRSKDPGYPHWQDLRLSPANLDRFFPRSIVRDANVGILNGSPSHNHVDVDLDCSQARKAAPMLLPATAWIFGRASSPRSHWIFRVVDRSLDTAQMKFTDTDESMLIELRGTGGLTVYPPSTHKETGEPITWDRFETPGEVLLADLQSAVGALAAAAILARHWPAKGQRDQAAMALTGGLLRAGWSEEKVPRFVQAVAVAAGDDEVRMRTEKAGPAARKLEEQKKVTGWPTLAELVGEEVVSKVRQWLGVTPQKRRSSSKGSPHQFQVGEWVSPTDRDNWGQIIEDLGNGRYLVHFVSPEGTEANVEFTADQLKPKDGTGKAKVRVIPPYETFPIETLPHPLDQFVRQGAAALGCDPCYLALPCLTVAAAAIGNTRTIKLKRGWEEPSIVWSAIVGDSGTMKSPAYLKAVDPVLRRQRQLLEAFNDEKARYDEELSAYQASKKRSKNDGADPGDPPQEPILKRLVCSDTTVEKLAEILEDNPRGILVGRDELSGWLGSFDRYKVQKGGGDLANWLEMFRAGTAIVDRKSALRKTLYIRRASVSVTGGIQPGVLARALTQEFLDAGLGARLLMAMPRKVAKTWSEVEVDPEVEQAYEDILDKLLALDLNTHPKTGEKVPHVLTISPDAKSAWIEFYNAWGREQANAEGELAAAFSKLEGYAARFALIHHVTTHRHLDSDDLRPVGRKSIETGIVLAKWFAHEAERIYAILSESDDERAARCLMEYIRARGGEITVKELQRSNSKKYPTADHAEVVLQALVPQYGEWVDKPAGPKGGRPTRVLKLQLDPPDETDETSPEGEKPAKDSSDETSQIGPTKPEFLGGKWGFVGFVGSRIEVKGSAEPSAPGGEVSSDGEGVSSDGRTDGSPFRGKAKSTPPEALPPYLLVAHQEDLGAVAQALDETVLVGLDLETTGLDARLDRVRLLSLAVDTIDGGTFCYLVDCFQVDPTPLWEILGEKDLVGHHLAFDLGFLARLGFTPAGKVHDTMLLAQVLGAGTLERVNLAACCERYLGQTLDKELQGSDWSEDLSKDQLAYAARDVDVLVPSMKS